MIPIGNICEHDSLNQKPQITEEEDRPFPGAVSFSSDGSPKIQDVPSVMKLNDQKHSQDVDNFKNKTGKHILYVCLGAMALAAIADAIFHIESSIFTSAFEVTKVVSTTILGYLFGSKSK